MNLLAAAVVGTTHTAVDRLRQIPMEFWLKVGLGVVVIVATVIVLRKVVHMNKVILGVGVGLVATFVGFNWIYERNEPGWASTPVQWLAGFFPTKGKIEAKGRL